MEKLFAAVQALEIEPALAWPVATVLPFLADPARHAFLSPRTTCTAAERLGCDLRYDATPSWPTYAALRALEAQLLAKLQPNGARDFIDVEAFLHATGTARATVSSKTSPKRVTARAAPSRRTR
jgi:hypothetical protein